jgi:hypothetical protein
MCREGNLRYLGRIKQSNKIRLGNAVFADYPVFITSANANEMLSRASSFTVHITYDPYL